MEQIDYEKAGQGLRNILRWLNENSTTNSNSNNNSGYLIPRNASPSANGWLCDYNYYINSSRKGCVRVPANAFSLDKNNNWSCISGYTKSGNNCIKKVVYIPPNAQSSASGWICYMNYY